MTRWVLSAVFLVCCTAGLPCAAEPLIGDGNDGNLSTPVHLIPLLDENGVQIRAGDKSAHPFSTVKTCGQCHSIDIIDKGWHFLPAEPNGSDGRAGQPFIFTDIKTRTVLPLSDRRWPGVFKPSQIGLSQWGWMNLFSSHIPGNAYGQFSDADKDPYETIRKQISGTFEINCLACHNADYRQDASAAALAAARQNYRWVAAASSGLAVVNGTALVLPDSFDPEFDKGVTVAYNQSVFDKDDNVFLDITRNIPDNRCYFCHSVKNLSVPDRDQWTCERDVHISSGLNCVDCHRNGLDHKIIRGEQASDTKDFSCEGCHLGSVSPGGGRLGAPHPRHAGIPTVHFEKLTCTACHSGPWPKEDAGQVATAAVDKLGLHGVHKVDLRLPHIYQPVFLKGPDGKIGPYRLIWPAYWGIMKDGKITPIAPKDVSGAAGDILESAGEKFNDWQKLSEEQILEALKRLAGKPDGGEPVYVCGGKVFGYQSRSRYVLHRFENPAASAYAWPFAHDVRPAGQSLGAGGCADCHTTDSAFFFGKVPADAPLPAGFAPVEMVKLQGLDRLYVWCFNFSFVFRPYLKAAILICCGVIGMVLLLYGLKALAVVTGSCVDREE